MKFAILVLAAMLLTACAVSSYGASFYTVGAGTTNGITADGQYVSFYNSTSTYIWSAAGGLKDLGVVSSATAGIAMKDGNIIVAANVGGVAKRWDGNGDGTGTWTSLPLVNSANWSVNCVSASDTNNDVWFGGVCSSKAAAYQQSTSSAALVAQPVNLTGNSAINGVSENGAYAGQAYYVSGGSSRQAMGGNPLASLNNTNGAPTTTTEAVAQAISRNGNRIVGWSNPATGDHVACYWDAPFIEGLSPVALPMLPGLNYADVKGISADGSIIAGYALDSTDTKTRQSYQGWIWDSVNGTRNLADIIGAEFLDGYRITDVTGMSADGRVLTGKMRLATDPWFNKGTAGTLYSWVYDMGPVPEPGSIFTVLSGLAGMAGLAICRRK